MKKNYLLCTVIILLTFNSFAQTYVLQYRPWESLEWGYMNINGEVVIEPQRRKCYDFSEGGLALVYYSKRNHYDIINLNGDVLDVEPEKFIVKEGFGYGAQGYSSGMLVIRIKKRWGSIDTKGKVIVPVKYDFISKFIDGYATARLKDEFYVIDSIGKETLIKEDDITKISKFSKDRALYTNKKGLMGFVNKQGEVVIPAKYKKVGYFNAGVAWARNMDGKIGFINKKGDWVIEPNFLAVRDFDPVSQLAKARVDEFWGYINKKGEIGYVTNAKKIYDYSEGIAMAVVYSGQFGYLDENQNWIIKPQFDAAREFKNGYAAVRKNGKWGIIDKSGEWIINPMYSGIKDVMKVN